MDSKADQKLDMRILIVTAVLGAVLGGIGFVLIKRYRGGCEDFDKPFKKLACKLEIMAQTASDMKVEFEENVDETIENVQQELSRKMEIWAQGVKDALFTSDMQEALDTVQFLMDNLKKFDMEAKNYEGFGFVLLALVKKAQDCSDFAQWEKNLPEINTVVDTSQLQRAQKIGQYAINVYPASWRSDLESIGQIMEVPETDILFVWFQDDPDDGHCPKFILFLDHKARELVLAVRGTFSIRDIVLDIVCDEEPFLQGFAHKGILYGAQKIMDKVGDLLTSSLLLNSGYSVTVTGHSLGAGTAELITLDITYGEGKKLLPPGTKVSCVALAPPPVYRPHQESGGEDVSLSPAIEIYINNYDCVPRLSLGSIARLLASMRAVDNLGLSLSQQFAILASSTEGQDVNVDLDRVVTAVREARQDQFPFLQHPGKIFYLKRSQGEDKSQKIYQQDSQTFSSAIFLLDNMVMDHLQPSYEEALNNVVLS